MAKLQLTRTYTAMNEVGEDAVARLKKWMGQLNLDATKRTSKSLKHRVTKKGAKVIMEVSSRKKKGLDVIGLADQGRGPGLPPPYKEIAKGIRAKGIKITDSKGRYKKSNNKNINRAAYGIAQYIGRRGTIKRFGYKGSNIFDKALWIRNTRYRTKIEDAFGQDLEKFINSTIPPENRPRK